MATSKFELSIDVNYVKSWGIVEAVREFFQNSYDEEQQNPDNKSYFRYDNDRQVLIIGNKLSILKSETLLLGCTSKDSDENTIGQFGEGYKIATVVALRTGHEVTIYNYGAREVWTTRLVKSRRYNGRLVPTFYINKQFDWKSFFSSSDEEKNLQIEITNVTQEEYNDIILSNLNLNPAIPNKIETSYGDIIIDERDLFNKKIYVSGLYVYTDQNMTYSYNIKSKYLRLDRDRMAVNSFDLQWLTAKMWMEAAINNKVSVDQLVSMLEENYSDISYINSAFSYDSSNEDSKNNLVNRIYSKFIQKYGRVIPVTSEDMRRKLELSDNKVAYVSAVYYNILSRYSGNDTVIVKEETYYDRYKKLLDSLREFMTEDQIKEADYLLKNTEYILK